MTSLALPARGFSRQVGVWCADVRAAANDSVKYARRHLTLLGWVAIFSLMSYYFVWTVLYPDDFTSLWLRLGASAMCVPLLLVGRLPARFEASLQWYWLLTLTIVLPLVFGYELAQNAARATALGATNLIWPLQNVVALVLFMMLVNNGLLSTVLWVVVTAFVSALVLLGATDPNIEELARVYFEPLPLYGFILVVGSLAIRNREIIDQEKLSAVAAVGSTIAHELRTPCMGIAALSEGIQSYLPTLVAGYETAVDHGLEVKRIRARHLEALKHSLGRIKDETDYANRVIDMLLINSSDQPLRGLEFELFSAAACVRKAVRRFPFASAHERTRLSVRIDGDFTIRAPEVLLVHVLFNLIKNANYYVEKAGGGGIEISTSAATRVICVEDNGTGIPPENLSRIFDRFFTTTETGHGSGIGLSFCRMVMDGVRGSIRCESEVGDFTRFTLQFPEVDDD